MKEVIYRRYLRLSLENAPMPDLIVMDGGKIQVNAALEIIKLLNLTIPVMGIEKMIITRHVQWYLMMRKFH